MLDPYEQLQDAKRQTFLELSDDSLVKLLFDNARNWLICATVLGVGAFLLKKGYSPAPYPVAIKLLSFVFLLWGMLLGLVNFLHGTRKFLESLMNSGLPRPLLYPAAMAFQLIYMGAAVGLVAFIIYRPS